MRIILKVLRSWRKRAQRSLLHSKLKRRALARERLTLLTVRPPTCIEDRVCNVKPENASRVSRRVQFSEMKIAGGETYGGDKKGFHFEEYALVLEEGEYVYCEGSYIPVKYFFTVVLERNFPRGKRSISSSRLRRWKRRAFRYNEINPDVVTQITTRFEGAKDE